MKVKSMIRTLVGAFILGSIASVVHAGIPSDSFTLTVTPTGDRGVIIGSSTVNLAGVVGSTQTTGAIPVTSTGSIGNIDYTISASAFATWTFSTDGSNDATDEAIVRAAFKESGAGTPADGEFGTGATGLLSTTAQDVGDGSGEFEGLGADLDGMGLNEVHDLYIRVVLPQTSSTQTAQSTTITVTAELND